MYITVTNIGIRYMITCNEMASSIVCIDQIYNYCELQVSDITDYIEFFPYPMRL